MTTTPYGPPATTTAPAGVPSRSAAVRVLRVLLAVLLVLGAWAAAALAALFSYVTATGCFLSCSEPQPGAGAALGLLAVALLAAGPFLAWLMWRTSRSSRGLVVWSVLVLGPLGLSLLLSGLSPLLPFV